MKRSALAALLLPAVLGPVLAAALAGCSFGASRADQEAALDPTRCPAAEQMTPAADSAYGQRFLARVSKQIAYPSEALEAGQIGDVRLCARLSRDGVVKAGRIAAGSGYPVLDGVALVAVGKLGSAGTRDAEPMPKDFAHGKDSVWLVFPVSFAPEAGASRKYLRALEDRPCKDTGSKEGDIDSQQVTLKEWGDFPGIFSDAVKQELVYPPTAVDAHQSGYTLLCVSLDRDSHLLGASISRGSGSALLDGASLIALGMVQLKYRMPPVPDRVRQAHDRITFTQEIEWKKVAP